MMFLNWQVCRRLVCLSRQSAQVKVLEVACRHLPASLIEVLWFPNVSVTA